MTPLQSYALIVVVFGIVCGLVYILAAHDSAHRDTNDAIDKIRDEERTQRDEHCNGTAR